MKMFHFKPYFSNVTLQIDFHSLIYIDRNLVENPCDLLTLLWKLKLSKSKHVGGAKLYI
jgi:hypothetical protein